MGAGSLQKIEILNDHTKTQSDAGLWLLLFNVSGFSRKVFHGRQVVVGVCVNCRLQPFCNLAQKISATRRTSGAVTQARQLARALCH